MMLPYLVDEDSTTANKTSTTTNDNMVAMMQGDVEDLHAEMQEDDDNDGEGAPFLLDGSIHKDEDEASGGIIKICGLRTRPMHRAFCIASLVLTCILLLTMEAVEYMPSTTNRPVGKSNRGGDGAGGVDAMFLDHGGNSAQNATIPPEEVVVVIDPPPAPEPAPESPKAPEEAASEPAHEAPAPEPVPVPPAPEEAAPEEVSEPPAPEPPAPEETVVVVVEEEAPPEDGDDGQLPRPEPEEPESIPPIPDEIIIHHPLEALHWFDDHPAFAAELKQGRAKVEAVRNALWEKHAPHSEDFFPGSVSMFNEEPLRARFVHSILHQAPFVIGVMGTSVTAGHDNAFVESYPIVWEGLMKEAFAATGVELIMRNHAMGWNPIFPSYLCVGEMIGDDVDISVWEFGMMGGYDRDFEVWMRNSLSLPKQPHVLILDPGIDPRQGAKEKRADVKPGPWKTPPMSWYSDAGFSVASNQMHHAWWYLDHLEAYDYETVMVKDKKSTRPASWHPGPHGHALRAELLAYTYLGYFLNAIDIVLDTLKVDDVKSIDLTPIIPNQIEMPSPHECSADFCGTPPKCVTTFLPRVGESVMNYVIFPHPDDIPMVTDSHEAEANLRSGWHQQLYFCDVFNVDFMLSNKFDYLDRKIILQGTTGDGPLLLEFLTQTENYFIFCSAPGNKHMCTSTTWKLNGEEVECYDDEAQKAAGFPSMGENCYMTPHKLPPGNHLFEITVTEFAEDAVDKFIPISHLIWW